jgi:hypothetical protein
MLHKVNILEESNTSLIFWYKAIFGQISDEELAKFGSCWVDVRDLALAHVLALEKEEAYGQRIIVSAGEDVKCAHYFQRTFNGIPNLGSFILQDWGMAISCNGVNY